MRLSLTSMNFDHKGSGYGRLGQELAAALTKLGVTVESHDEKQETVPAIAIYPQLPMHVDEYYEGQKTVAICMFEADSLPDPFTEVIANYDRVIVPCEENRRLFSEFHPDVRKVPLGVNPEMWKPGIRTLDPNGNNPYTFLCAGNGWWRKGFHIAVDAFKMADIPNSRLILKGNKGEGYQPLHEEHIGGDKRIILLKEWLTNEAEVRLYQNADCYVGPSMGEGWGLQPHQAIACGVPTIITAAAGHLEYIHLATPLRYHKERANYGIWGWVGEWWVPTAEDLAELMVQEYKHPTSPELRLINSWAARKMSWDATARRLLENLSDWDPTPIPNQGTVPFEHKLFPIITTEDFSCEIAWKPYVFKAWTEYWVPADVKRVLYDAKKLDRDTAERRTAGLLPRQIEEKYIPAVCPTCHQRVESLVE